MFIDFQACAFKLILLQFNVGTEKHAFTGEKFVLLVCKDLCAIILNYQTFFVHLLQHYAVYFCPCHRSLSESSGPRSMLLDLRVSDNLSLPHRLICISATFRLSHNTRLRVMPYSGNGHSSTDSITAAHFALEDTSGKCLPKCFFMIFSSMV